MATITISLTDHEDGRITMTTDGVDEDAAKKMAMDGKSGFQSTCIALSIIHLVDDINALIKTGGTFSPDKTIENMAEPRARKSLFPGLGKSSGLTAREQVVERILKKANEMLKFAGLNDEIKRLDVGDIDEDYKAPGTPFDMYGLEGVDFSGPDDCDCDGCIKRRASGISREEHMADGKGILEELGTMTSGSVLGKIINAA